MKIDVKGHSGCSIDVVDENGKLYIIKATDSPSYTSRLARQALKQRAETKFDYPHMRIPEIYDIYNNGSHAHIKMEYVYSKNFIEFFEQSGFEQLNYFIEAIISYIEKEIEYSPVVTVPRQTINTKFNSVYNSIISNPFIKNDTDFMQMIIEAQKIIQCPDITSIDIPVGRCHGDLTLSNILFSGNNYYLIDFLDSFIESPLLDIVKIRQDTCWNWSELMYSGHFDRIRLRIILKHLDEAIVQHFSSKYPWYNKYYPMMQLLNFMRILQYAKEAAIISYLKSCIKKQINEF